MPPKRIFPAFPTPSSYQPLHSAALSFLVSILPLCTTLLLLHNTYCAITSTKTPSITVTTPDTIITHIAGSFGQIDHILYLPTLNTLLISDVFADTIYAIPTNHTTFPTELLQHAGGAHNDTHATSLRRPGVSALASHPHHPHVHAVTIAIAQHAARAIALLTLHKPDVASTSITPDATAPVIIVNSFNGSRLNAPSALTFDAHGNLFFTDAHFGLVAARDEFDRQVDSPPGLTQPAQNVYYIPATHVQKALQTGVPAEPKLLVYGLDRPAGIAVSQDGRTVYVAVASPRSPHLIAYSLGPSDHITGEENAPQLRVRQSVVLHDWTADLHGWSQRFMRGVLGPIAMQGSSLYVGAGNTVVRFDTDGVSCTGPVTLVEADVPPRPANVAIGDDGDLFVATSTQIVKISTLEAAPAF